MLNLCDEDKMISPNDNFSPDPGGRVNPRTAYNVTPYLAFFRTESSQLYHGGDEDTWQDEVGQIVECPPAQPGVQKH